MQLVAKIIRIIASWNWMWSMQLARLSLVLDFKHQERELECWNEKKRERKCYRERFPKKKKNQVCLMLFGIDKILETDFHEEGGFLECLSLMVSQESQDCCLFPTNTQTMLNKYLECGLWFLLHFKIISKTPQTDSFLYKWLSI